MRSTPEELLALHRDLDRRSRTGRGHFISGWQTTHPFVGRYLSPEGLSDDASDRYSFLADQVTLTEAIQKFHVDTEETYYGLDSIYPSAGASPLLIAFFLSLTEIGIRDIRYVPPIYYSCHFFAHRLGMTAKALETDLLHAQDARLKLPDSRVVLLLCDPIWVLGVSVHECHLNRIREWQERTGSIVLVDGTFQYTKWDGANSRELTAYLHPEQTFRLVCPTKSLAAHGVRFAYLLLPARYREAVRYACANVTGATGVANERNALRMMQVLNSVETNRGLVGHIRTVHRSLVGRGVLLEEAAAPTASYYTFGRLSNEAMKDAIVMDQRFFELSGYDGYVRVNLLSERWLPWVAAGEGS